MPGYKRIRENERLLPNVLHIAASDHRGVE
jgi:hypothetical protein